MSRFVRIGLLCGVFSLALLPVARAHADEWPKAPKAAGDRLTTESLKAILEGLGYEEVRELKDKDGKVLGYEVKRLVDTWVYYGTFSLSPDQSQLWITLNGPKIDPAAAPAKVLLEMLAVNDNLWPSYFAYSEKSERFTLYLPTPNTGLKAKDVRTRFD